MFTSVILLTEWWSIGVEIIEAGEASVTYAPCNKQQDKKIAQQGTVSTYYILLLHSRKNEARNIKQSHSSGKGKLSRPNYGTVSFSNFIVPGQLWDEKGFQGKKGDDLLVNIQERSAFLVPVNKSRMKWLLSAALVPASVHIGFRLFCFHRVIKKLNFPISSRLSHQKSRCLALCQESQTSLTPWKYLLNSKPGHATGRSDRGARRGCGTGLGKLGRRQINAHRRQSSLKLPKASKTRPLNDLQKREQAKFCSSWRRIKTRGWRAV